MTERTLSLDAELELLVTTFEGWAIREQSHSDAAASSEMRREWHGAARAFAECAKHLKATIDSHLPQPEDFCPVKDWGAMHRHSGQFVSHLGLDHDHGNCSDHNHWAGGHHEPGTDLEISTPQNDPLGWAVKPLDHLNERRREVAKPRIGVDVHSAACVDDDGKVECCCGLDDIRVGEESDYVAMTLEESNRFVDEYQS